MLLVAASLATLEADLKAVAALRGEPSVVSAAGLTRDDAPILTIENTSAFEATPAKLRLVLIGVSRDERTADAVVGLVRWFKTQAPEELRRRWSVSALPLSPADPSEMQAVNLHWLPFQAWDLIVHVGIGRGVAGERTAGIPPDGGPPALERLLRAPTTISPSHDTLIARVTRDPLAVARVLARRYPETPAISYISALSWVGALRVAAIDKDESLRTKVREQTRPWLAGDKPLFGDRVLLTSVAGTMVFAELASEGDAAAAKLADEGVTLAAAPRKPDGVATYGGGWTDDMFMASSVLARASRREGHAEDLDRAAHLLLDYASRLQRPDGLFNHAIDGPAAWGRGNGFAAFGLMEALTVMPASHPLRAQLLDVFRRQMAAVKAQQAPDGMWREVIDEPGAYREETATAMLLTAMARGIRLGWIDRSYAPVVERAWRALLAHATEDGGVIDVCASTAGGTTRRYYLDRPAITGADDRGGAMALTAALEMWQLSRR